MRPTHTLIGVLLLANFTIVEKDIHILVGVVEDALHSRAQEIEKINGIPQVNTSIPCPIYIFKEGHAACLILQIVQSCNSPRSGSCIYLR